MSNYTGYDVADNVQRKMNNTGDVVETAGQNKNVKSWSSKPGQLTAAQQAEYQSKLDADKNSSMPVKIYTEDEKKKLAEKMGLNRPSQNLTIVPPQVQAQEVEVKVKEQIEHLESLGFNPAQIVLILKMAA